MLAGAKLIGVVPVVGWWDRRAEMVGKELPFSLIISIAAAGIYNAVKVALAAPVTIEV